MEIRSPEPTDADGLGRVHVRAWQAAYRGGLMPDDYLDSLSAEDRATMWRDALQSPPRPRATRLVAEVNGEVAGFALVGPAGGDEGADMGELYAINVDPDHWGSGVGPALIDAGIGCLAGAGFDQAILWVHPDNARACRFYTNRGWMADGVERRDEVLGVEAPEARYSLARLRSEDEQTR
jgi:GNAT superfamily N-acetyltransferase